MKLNTKEFEEKMGKALSVLESNFGSIRAGQANSAVLGRVSFEYYGSPTPVTSMADIRVADSRTLTIKPYDASTLKAIEKAIQPLISVLPPPTTVPLSVLFSPS